VRRDSHNGLVKFRNRRLNSNKNVKCFIELHLTKRWNVRKDGMVCKEKQEFIEDRKYADRNGHSAVAYVGK
jgi:hypothetical protein